MKKTKRLINTFIILIILLGLLTSVTAATGKSFCNWQYNGGLIGPFAQSAYTIRNMLGVVGYTATDGHNSGWNIRDKLYINETKVYYMFGHSGAGHQGCEPGYLTISTTDAERAPISTISSNLSMVKLLYFQGCHTGEFDPVQNSCLDTAAYNKGADSTVAFMEQTTYYDPYTTNYGITDRKSVV